MSKKPGYQPYQAEHWEITKIPHGLSSDQLADAVNNLNLRHRNVEPSPPVETKSVVLAPAETSVAPEVEAFEESVLHNSSLVVGDQVKRFNFIDTDNAIFDVTSQLVGVSGKQQANVKVLVKTPQIMKGVVYVNTLPFTPTEMDIRYPSPSGIPDNKFYEMEYYDMVPPLYYGWSLYALIHHGFNLNDPDNYIIDFKYLQEYTDLTAYNLYDGGGNLIFDANDNFQNRFVEGYIDLLHYGLDANNIIVRAMYCPDIRLIPDFNTDHYTVYQNLGIKTKDNYLTDKYLEYLNETEHIIATNLVYNYTLMKGS